MEKTFMPEELIPPIPVPKPPHKSPFRRRLIYLMTYFSFLMVLLLSLLLFNIINFRLIPEWKKFNLSENDFPTRYPRPYQITRILDYKDGLDPWKNHINTDVNTTYEQVVYNFPDSRCSKESFDIPKRSSVKEICLTGEGNKMVYSPDMIFILPENEGLLEQEHMTGDIPYHYYDTESGRGTVYFLMPFEDYEIPTYYPEETAKFLPLWTNVFKNLNGMDDEYFRSHIQVLGTSVSNITRNNARELSFRIDYSFHVDWARIRLTDRMQYEVHDFENVTITQITDKEIYSAAEMNILRLIDDQDLRPHNFKTYIHRIEPVTKLADKETIKSAVVNSSKIPLEYNINGERSVELTNSGELMLNVSGTDQSKVNTCLISSIALKNAEMKDIDYSYCYIE